MSALSLRGLSGRSNAQSKKPNVVVCSPESSVQ